MAEHITIGDVAPRVHYFADGAQAAFTFPFPIFTPADLECWVDGIAQGFGFTVEGAGRSEGGTLRFAAPPRAGARIALRRRQAIARTTDFQPNGVLRANTLNDELDRQVAAIQEMRDTLSAAIRLHPSEPPAGIELPPPGDYGLGMLFLPVEAASRQACQRKLEEIFAAVVSTTLVLAAVFTPLPRFSTSLISSPAIRARYTSKFTNSPGRAGRLDTK